MTTGDSDDGYRVGPGKPPRHTQFKPGQSGNPTGRPKGKVNLFAEIERELMKFVNITDNGKNRRITKLQMMVNGMTNRAIKGDNKAAEIVIRTYGQAKEIESPAAADLPTTDADMVKRIKARLKLIDPEE